MPSARRNRGINSAELCAIAGSCDGGSVRPVSPPSSPSPTFAMRDTKSREYRAALRQRTDSAARAPALRFLRFYEAKVIYTARFTAAFLPPFSLYLPPRAGPPTEYRCHDEGLYFSNSTFPPSPARRAMHLSLLARLSTFDGHCAKRPR